MSFSRNLARARSHLIMVAALIAGTAYILVVERGEARRDAAHAVAVAAQAAAREGWEARLGSYPSAAAAGAAWDNAVARTPELRGLQVALEPGSGGVALVARPFSSEAEVGALCGQVRATDLACEAVPPR